MGSILEIRQQKRRRYAKICLLIILTSFILMMAGCGFAPTGDGTTGNKIFIKNDDEFKYLVSSGPDGDVYANFGFLGTTTLSPYKDYGINSASSGTILRDIALFCMNAVFGAGTSGEKGTDYFTNAGAFGTVTADPITILNRMNEATSGWLTGSGDSGGTIGSVASSLGTIVRSMAISILIAVWAMNFINLVVQERFTMEALLKGFMQLMMGIIVVMNADVLVNAFAKAGMELMEAVPQEGYSIGFSNFKEELFGQLSKISAVSIGMNILVVKEGFGTIWFDITGPVIVTAMLLFPLIQVLMLAYKIISIMIMRLLELYLRITLAPIPLAFAANNGFSHETIRYFRGVLACAAQPLLVVLAVLMLPSIGDVVVAAFGGQGSGTITGIPAVLALGISYLVANAFIGETKGLAQEIIAR